MLFKNLLNINTSFLNPLIQFLNAWYIPIIIMLVAGGIIYAIILGINLAKSDSSEKREIMKKRIVNASLTIVIVVALTFILQFVLTNIGDWTNTEQNIITNTSYVKEIKINDTGYKPDALWNGTDNNNCFVVELNSTDEVFKFVFTSSSDQFKINDGNEYTLNVSKDKKSGEFTVKVNNVKGLDIGFYKIKWSRTTA